MIFASGTLQHEIDQTIPGHLLRKAPFRQGGFYFCHNREVGDIYLS